ncbi:MAG: hypothetical protein E7317_12860 [Clostridiales bacterium]|nr:hypothetical protein [Clostridiales bacterium]
MKTGIKALGIALGLWLLRNALLNLGLRGLDALLQAWGATEADVVRLPAWAQVCAWAAYTLTMVVGYGVPALLGITYAGRHTQRTLALNGRGVERGLLAGLAAGAGVSVLALVADSMRREPALFAGAAAYVTILNAIAIAVAAVLPEIVSKRVVYDLTQNAALSALMFMFVTSSPMSPVGSVTALLMGLAGVKLYVRRGLLTSAGMFIGWRLATGWLFAWPNASGAGVFRLYTVSDAWLFGGDRGPEAGALVLGACALCAVFCWRTELRGAWSGLMKRMKKT